VASRDTSLNPNSRPFDVIVIGDGSFVPNFAHHLLYADQAHSRRTLVLEAGRLVLPEHVQNLPVLGLNVPGPISVDPGIARAEVWGMPWRTDVLFGFPGLAYCLGGRSVYFGGWSPQLLASETPAAWPAAVLADLNGPLPEATAGHRQPDQIGTTTTNDFIFESFTAHCARSAARASTPTPGGRDTTRPIAAAPVACPSARKTCSSWRPARHAGKSAAGRLLPFNVLQPPLAVESTRRAAEFGGGNTRKRLMVVVDCHVTRLITDGNGPIRRIVAVETNRGVVQVPEEAVVVLALGTIENGRIALVSLPGLPGVERIGGNLMAHLRSNLTIRLPRAAINGLDPNVKALQASALFVKGRHVHADGLFGHFHLQITAASLDTPNAELRPNSSRRSRCDTIDAFRPPATTRSSSPFAASRSGRTIR
jgi:hypothetical protein